LTNKSHRTVEACGTWVKSVDFDAKYFFFREEGNYHCSPCPQTYRGHRTSGTGHQNSKIYTYRILNWRMPDWHRRYRRVATYRFCSGYKKSAFNHRTIDACAKWVQQVDKEARYFFYRFQSNWHCSPCPLKYRGHPTTGTSKQNSMIHTFRIIGWKPPVYTWAKWYRRIAINRFCHGYKKSAYNHRTVEACGTWVKSIDDEARYFFFREEGNYHCAPCPTTYTGHPTTGTGHQNSRIYTYRILNWQPPAWTRIYKRITNKRFCHGYKKSAFNHRNVMNCGAWVRQVDPEARYFFFRHQSNWHCSPCPDSYTGHPTTGTGYQNSRIYVYRIINWRAPTYTWAKWYRRVTVRGRFCHGYKYNKYNFRKVEDCGAYIRKANPEARFFFFREEGNYHCASCPDKYRGGSAGTGKQNSRIYTYRILNWRPPTYSW